MSKKNLAKTSIEGGRSCRNKQHRRESSKVERVNVRAIISGSHGDPEVFDEIFLPKRKKVYKDFYDKISPVERWLDTRVGKSWNKTYSLLKEKFDVRTTVGRHIVYDHILKDVWTSLGRSNDYAKYYRYYVDACGILRRAPSWRKESELLNKQLYAERVRAEEWLDRRMIGKVGNVLRWYNPTVRFHVEKFDWNMGRFNQPGSFFIPRFIQGDRLKGTDIDFLMKLSSSHRESILKNSKILGSCQCVHAVHHHLGDMCRIEGCKCEIKTID